MGASQFVNGDLRMTALGNSAISRREFQLGGAGRPCKRHGKKNSTTLPFNLIAASFEPLAGDTMPE
jgi:hypothetical protein